MTDGLPLETVTLEGPDGIIGGWQTVSLRASAEEGVRTGSFTFAMPPLAEIGKFKPRPDLPVTIKVSGDLWLTGKIGDVAPDHNEDGGSVSVEVQSKTIDAVETSVDHPEGYAENVDLLDIANTFDKTGVKWRSIATLTKNAWHDVNPGESPFETVERVARGTGKLIYDDENGDAVIADKPEGRHSGGLELGVNIVSGSAALTSRGQHSSVKVRGQSSIGHGAGALRTEAEVAGTISDRIRPRVVILEDELTEQKAKDRAAWEVRRAAGKGKTASIVTSGWRDASGELWTRNWLVELNNPLLFLQQDMVIKSVTFDQDAGQDGGTGTGTKATLELADPRALGSGNSEAGKSKSDSAWAVPTPRPKATAS